MKLVIVEPQTPALRDFLRSRPRRFVSRIGEVEVARALARSPGKRAANVARAFERVELVEVTAEITTGAGAVRPATLRSLDAIHLASALAVADDLDAFVTYDARLADAARGLGLTVVAPS